MNLHLYACEVTYTYSPIVTGDQLSQQKASEFIVAGDEEEARTLFYDLHREGFKSRAITPDQITVQAMRYNVNAVKGRYNYGETPPS